KVASAPLRVTVVASGRVMVQVNVRGSAAPAGSVAAALRATALASVPPAGTVKSVMVGATLSTVIVVLVVPALPSLSGAVRVTTYVALSSGVNEKSAAFHEAKSTPLLVTFQA